MIINEYGKRLILRAGYDLSGNAGDDGLRFEISKPDGSVVTYNKAAGVELGATDAEVTDEKGRKFGLEANQYAYRDWTAGELDQAGAWRARLVYQDGSKQLVSRQALFVVEP